MQTILDLITGTMGLPTINENLVNLLTKMAEHPANVGSGVIIYYAKMIGLLIALGVGANECFQMMLGRRGLDVMKLIHIVIISLCISFSGTLVNMAAVPGQALEDVAYSRAMAKNEEVKKKEAEVAAKQEEYLNRVREHLHKIEEANKAQEEAENGESGNIIVQIKNSIEQFKNRILNSIKEKTILLETKITEWINLIIRFIGEVIFQVSYYGILICKAIFLNILGTFAPLMFAISLSPHYKSAWSQWLSKYISISLWGYVTYIVLYYVAFIMIWSLDLDIKSYDTFLENLSKDTEGDVQVGAIGMQAIGTTCMYVVGLLIGVKALAFVPEVSSWLIPGGVSSGAGSMASAGTAAAGMAAGAGAAVYRGATKVK